MATDTFTALVLEEADGRVKSSLDELPLDKLDAMSQSARLADLPKLAGEILKGQVLGRVAVETGG